MVVKVVFIKVLLQLVLSLSMLLMLFHVVVTYLGSLLLLLLL